MIVVNSHQNSHLYKIWCVEQGSVPTTKTIASENNKSNNIVKQNHNWIEEQHIQT